MDTNRALLNEIYQAFEEIFEYNDYTWDEIEFRIAYAQQKKIKQISCDGDLYSSDKKQLLTDIHSYLSYYLTYYEADEYRYYTINDNIHNTILKLNGIIRFDYKRMKEANENLYLELNKVILNPERIQNMATIYDIDFFDYLDAIM